MFFNEQNGKKNKNKLYSIESCFGLFLDKTFSPGCLQELLSHFDEFKQNLDKLRTKGSDIIQHSSDQGEKHSVQKTIAVINRQWLSLQAQTADRTQELTEAADLAHAVDDVASSVYTWVTQAETVLSSHLDWSDFDSVRDQLKSHRVCV